ncbi:hypothetical protein [Pseudomonas sp. SDO5271_S396]
MNLLDPLSGNEPLTQGGASKGAGFLNAFWGWGFSALHDPLLRGYLAEFLVYQALLTQHKPPFQIPTSHFSTKMEGDVHDLVFFMGDEKFTLQVKSKDSFSKSQTFDTSFAQGYDCTTNTSLPADHWSDFYVFAYLTLNNDHCAQLKALHEQWNPNPSLARPRDKLFFKATQKEVVHSVLELDNWRFFVMEREHLRGQKSITLNSLRTRVARGQAVQTDYDGLMETLMELACLRYAKHCAAECSVA